jgi:two-component system chemotaxis sensor kinase CheA
VLDAAGKLLGVAQVGFSLARESAAIRVIERRTLLAALLFGLTVAIVLLALTRSLIVLPLSGLADAARRFEAGEAVRMERTGADEVGELARAFSAMMATISKREARIEDRNRDLRRVLDNVAEGFVSVDRAGLMSAERSRVLDQWFGPPAASGLLSDYLAKVAPEVGHWVRLGWTSLDEDIMPAEVVLEQLGRRLTHQERSFELEFRGIFDDEARLTEVLVVVRDVTERVERERAEQAQREAIAIVRRILADPAGFDEFFAEATALVDLLGRDDDGGDPLRVVRAIHTLKGAAGLFEIESVVLACHELEQHLADEGRAPDPGERAHLESVWCSVVRLREQLGAGRAGGDHLTITRQDHERLLAELDAGVAPSRIADAVRRWPLERASARLERMAEQVRSLGRRLQKAELEVRVEVRPADLRLPPERWSEVWSVFPHLLRNMVDHGIEDASERRRVGKGGEGLVVLSLSAGDAGAELSIADDGRGIDWQRLADRAASTGLSVPRGAAREELLFVDALSSRDAATEISGRGVGMGAVREAVRAHGGELAVESVAGVGTTFRLRFPAAMLTPASSAPGAVAPRREAA